ncbi:MAG: NAD-dependent succinate-semialdehyde dehydrogenase [Raineya sp.]|nr:NAD-dependent succinate-semialdehyde dehydrogenase [Raineya sp.]MDW8296515.1 NAD-dependent succinate-semialdehyde dehydrogenase [Raineya sp.]
MFESRNPFTQEVYESFSSLDSKELEAKLHKADIAYRYWREISLEKRIEKIKVLAENLLQRKEHYAQLICREMGKIIREARAEIEKCAWLCEYYAENAEKFLANEPVSTGAYKSYITYEPLGAVLGIMPWNFPFWQVFRFAIPTLLAGNVVLLKHAPNVPVCAIELEKLFLQAGFEEGIFQNLMIETDLVEKAIAHPVVQAVTLTGSEKAGRAVASLAGKHLKKSVMELGGSDAFIVLADADIELAARNACVARMINNGQSCIAAKRFIVAKPIFHQFLEKLKENFQKLRHGNPLEEQTDYACLARVDLAENLSRQVQESLKVGNKLILGNAKNQETFFEPSIIEVWNYDSPAFCEELFGPVASVVWANDEKTAIQLANMTSYGLGASIWTKDLEKAEHLTKHLQAGSVFVNTIVKSMPQLPFGGIKNSGYGRELSVAGIREFTNIKSVLIEK